MQNSFMCPCPCPCVMLVLKSLWGHLENTSRFAFRQRRVQQRHFLSDSAHTHIHRERDGIAQFDHASHVHSAMTMSTTKKKRWQHSFTTVAHILVTRIHFVQHRSNHTEKYSKLNERLERRSKQKKNLLGEQKNCTMIDSNQNDGIIKYLRNVDDEKLLLRMECKIYADARGQRVSSIFRCNLNALCKDETDFC